MTLSCHLKRPGCSSCIAFCLFYSVANMCLQGQVNNSLKSYISYEKQVLGNYHPLSTYSDYLSLFLSHLDVIQKSALMKVC